MPSKSPVTSSNAPGSPKSNNKAQTGSRNGAANNSCGCGCTSSDSRSSGRNIQAASSGRNQWTEFAQDKCALSDKEIISDVLGCQKSLVKLYGNALCETSCTKLRDLIETQLSECAVDQFDAFLYMNERGMYPTDNAPMPKVAQAQKKFNDCEQKMR